MPLPPEEAENGENAGNEEPKLQFSYVECLLYSFHQLGRKLPDFLTTKLNTERVKDFKIRLCFFFLNEKINFVQTSVEGH